MRLSLRLSLRVRLRVRLRRVHKAEKRLVLLWRIQSGFLPGCSTTHHLVHLYHSISEAFDKGLKVQMVFGDILL